LPPAKNKTEKNESAKIAIVGKPNVGKSSLLNAIIGEEKIIVSPVPHTTREPKDLDALYKDNLFTFIDTAGIVKKKSKTTKNELIKLGILKSLSTIKKADIALLVVDISEDVSHQETKITDEILKCGVSVIIVANKWDLIKDKDAKQCTRQINAKLPFVQWAPIIFMSAKNKTKIDQLLELIIKVQRARNKKIDQDELQKFLQSAVTKSKPLADIKVRGIIKKTPPRIKLKRLEQIATNPPTFSLQIDSKFGLRDNYIKYLENKLREKFGLVGTPIIIKVKLILGY